MITNVRPKCYQQCFVGRAHARHDDLLKTFSGKRSMPETTAKKSTALTPGREPSNKLTRGQQMEKELTPPFANAMAMIAAASMTHERGFHMNPKNFRILLSCTPRTPNLHQKIRSTTNSPVDLLHSPSGDITNFHMT